MPENIVVIGAGVGGLLTGARLARAGHSVLILESSDQVGGRFGTIYKDGYRIPTGAIAVAEGGSFHRSLQDLEIPFELRFPEPALQVLVRGKTLTAGTATWDFLMKRVTKQAARVAKGLRSETTDEGDPLTIAEWTRSHTKNKTVNSLIETVARNVFTCNADEVPAHLFFKNVREGAAYNRFGYAPRGNHEIAEMIADSVRANGGAVRFGWTATRIEIENGRATAVWATGPEGEEQRLPAAAIVSNAGPVVTARLVAGTPVERAFRERIAEVQPTSMLALSISTDEDHLSHVPGMLNFTDTDRLCSIANMTALCPELAPEGRTLYDVYSVPRPSVGGDFDVDDERARLETDLHKALPWTRDADVVHFKAMRGENPALRCGPVENPSVATPVVNLVDVGDGVRPGALIGTSASAQTAETAVELLLRAHESAAISG